MTSGAARRSTGRINPTATGANDNTAASCSGDLALLQSLLARLRQIGRDATPAHGAARLRELDREIDQEQALQWSAAVLALLGILLSLALHPVFALLPALAFAMLGQHAVLGWCPPLPLLARLGLRSSSDIDRERYALAAALEERHAPSLAASDRSGAA